LHSEFFSEAPLLFGLKHFKANMISPKLAAALFASFAAVAAQTSEPAESTVLPSLPAIQSAAAAAVPQSPVSNVQGLAFNRFIQVWLENTVSIYMILYLLLLTAITGLQRRIWRRKPKVKVQLNT
jgi:hypothetical protein